MEKEAVKLNEEIDFLKSLKSIRHPKDPSYKPYDPSEKSLPSMRLPLTVLIAFGIMFSLWVGGGMRTGTPDPTDGSFKPDDDSPIRFNWERFTLGALAYIGLGVPMGVIGYQWGKGDGKQEANYFANQEKQERDA